MSNQLANWIDEKRDWIADNAPDGYTADKIRRMALSLRSADNADLQKCTPESMVRAVLRCVHLGLDVERGEAVIIARYKKKAGHYEAEVKPLYTGLVRLARKNPQVADIKSDLVREGDHVEYRRTIDGVHFVHEPDPFGDGDVIGAYCIVELTDAVNRIERMSRADLDAVRDKAEDKSFAWNDFPGEMQKKAVTRRALKWLDLDPEARQLIREDDERSFSFGPQNSSTSAKRPRTINEMVEAQPGRDQPDNSDTYSQLTPPQMTADAADDVTRPQTPETTIEASDEATDAADDELKMRLQTEVTPDDAQLQPKSLAQSIMLMTPGPLREPFRDWLVANRAEGDTIDTVPQQTLQRIYDKLNGKDDARVSDLIESWIY